MTCKERGRVIRLARAMQYLINTELSSHEETRFEFNRSTGAIKLGIDVHQDFYVVVEQVEGVIRSRRSDSTSKRSCIGQASLSKGAPKCMQSMKRAGLVFLCSAISGPWASNATWSVHRSWMSATSG